MTDQLPEGWHSLPDAALMALLTSDLSKDDAYEVIEELSMRDDVRAEEEDNRISEALYGKGAL